jgi:hypothetical protein
MIKALVKRVDRISDLYDVGPAHRAAVEDFVDIVLSECCQVVYEHADTYANAELITTAIRKRFEYPNE